VQKTKSKLTEFIIPSKAINVLKLMKLMYKYFGDFLLSLFYSTWDNVVVIIIETLLIIIIFLQRASFRSKGILIDRMDTEVGERSTVFFKLDEIAEIN